MRLSLWEWMVKLTVKVLPEKLIRVIISLLPPDLLAKSIGSLRGLRTYSVSIFGVDLLLESGPRDDHYLDLEKNQMQEWETEVLRIWKNEVTNAENVVDIGAYLGVYSILAAKLGVAKVFAFEPNSHTYMQLKQNLAINSVSSSVDILQVAVGSTDRRVSIITPRDRPYSSAAQIDDSPTNRKLDSWTHAEKVRMVTLDSILSHSIQNISAIKIDAEGYEKFVLEGAIQILSQSAPSLIIEILSRTQKDDIDNFLSRFGYPPGHPIEELNTPTNYIYKIAKP